MHFGYLDTSQAEGAYQVVKSYLQVSTEDLHTVLEKLSHLLKNQHTEHEAAISTAWNCTIQDFRIPLLESVVGYITLYVLRKVIEQK